MRVCLGGRVQLTDDARTLLPLSISPNPINDTRVLSSIAAVLIGVAEATQEEHPRNERQALRSAPGR